MGKTASQVLYGWILNKTSPFEFYQYWRNISNANVLKCIRLLTFLSLEEIEEMDSWDGSRLNAAKEILAYELTSLVHGKEEADKAMEAARALFTPGADSANVPSFALEAAHFTAEGPSR